MAVLEKIRKRNVLLICIIALGLFAFIAGDMFKTLEDSAAVRAVTGFFTGEDNVGRGDVGKVLGENVTYQDYQELMAEYTDALKFTQGNETFSDEEQNQINDQVWQAYVSNKIIEAEAKKLGLAVTDKEMQDILKEGTNPMLLRSPFVNQQTGRFDLTLLTKFQDEMKKGAAEPELAQQYQTIYRYWLFIERTLREQTLAMKYESLLGHCLISNPISAKMAFDGQNTESEILLAAMTYASINDNDVKISDADLKEAYNKRKEEFRQYLPTRDIKYVTVHITASTQDRADLMKKMQAASDSLRAGADPALVVGKAQSDVNYIGIPVSSRVLPRDIAAKLDSMQVGQTTAPFETAYDNTLNVIKLINKTQLPDSVEYRQIRVFDNSIDVAHNRADSIYNALKGGADFAELAAKYGQKGEKVWFTSSMYEGAPSIDADSKQLLDALLTLNPNETKNLAFTQGNIVIQVLSRRAMTTKYDAAIVKHTIDFSPATRVAAYNKFSQFVSENPTLEDLEKNAPKFGYTVQERRDFSSNEHAVAGLRGTTEALRWVFEANVGEVSKLYDQVGNNDHLLVVAVTGIHKKGYREFDVVKDEVKSIVLNDKKYEMIAEKLKGVTSIDAAKQKGAVVDTVSQITFPAPVFVQAINSSEPAISGVVAATQQGKFNPAVIRGNNGAYMVQVVKKTPREGATFDAKAVEQQLRQQALQAARLYRQELMLKANIIDVRYKFFN